MVDARLAPVYRDLRFDIERRGIPLVNGWASVRVTHMPTGISGQSNGPEELNVSRRAEAELVRKLTDAGCIPAGDPAEGL